MKKLLTITQPKRIFLFSFLFILSFLIQNHSFGQCANCNAQYPAGTQSTTSNTLTTVNTCIYGGEYAVYNVTAGQTYTWTTCGFTAFDTQLTLWTGNSCGTGFLAYNDDFCGLQSTITWTATFTGTVNLLVSRYNCGNQTSCMTVQWACTSCNAVPGCTNPSATNYNPLATVDDGSCVFPGVDYVHPTVGINQEFVGSCLVSDCGPFVYADDGSLGLNYSNNIGVAGFGGIYRVFCPEVAGNCMQVTFNSFNVAAGDYMTVGNGPTQNSPFFTTPPAPGTGQITGSPAVPFTYNSTDASGCLTFRFYSNGVTTAPGWGATLQCVPCAGGPSGTDNNDCITMTPLCSGAAINSNATGPGIQAEGCTGSDCPAGGENHTNWYTFTAQTSGTINLMVTPTTASDDYDYAIYGPNASCNALGNPLNCSDAAVTGNTGIQNVTPNQYIEDVTGDGMTETIVATAGDSYILVVDEWSSNSGSGYTLNFSGTASLDCNVLPVELSEFSATYIPEEHIVDLLWITQSEFNCAKFEVEKSTDGENYEVIYTVDGAGTTNNETHYYVADPNPSVGVNYYRLNQIDTDGASRKSEVRSVNILDNVYDLLSFYPNPTSGQTEVIFNSYKKETVQLQVLGFDGKVVVRTELQAEKGGNRFDLDLSDLNGSVYMITITTSDKVYSGKLIKK